MDCMIVLMLLMSSFLCGSGAVVNVRDDYDNYDTTTVTNVLCENGTLVAGAPCDGTADCQDLSDESGCADDYTYDYTTDCVDGQVVCGDGSCVNGSQCDNVQDCADGVDETNCVECAGWEVLCANNTCVNGTDCNSVEDCADGSDELNCGSCTSDQYSCLNELKCIPSTKQCNGVADCMGGDDEVIGCTTLSPATTTSGQLCDDDQYDCGDGTCIRYKLVCDGTEDCLMGEDELDCGCNATTEFQCDDGLCLELSQRCDGVVDCLDEDDEAGCATTSIVDTTMITATTSTVHATDPLVTTVTVPTKTLEITNSVRSTSESISEGQSTNVAVTTGPTTMAANTTTTLKEMTKVVDITSAPMVIWCQYEENNFTAGTTIDENACNITFCNNSGSIVFEKQPNADPEKCSSLSNSINIALLVLVTILSSLLL